MLAENVNFDSIAELSKEWQTKIVRRPWGWYTVLEDTKTRKVKELVIEPGKSLSNQRHSKRSEHWQVLKGTCTLATEWQGVKEVTTLDKNSSAYTISRNVWHQAINNTNELCHILEVQYGEECVEEDIERRSN